MPSTAAHREANILYLDAYLTKLRSDLTKALAHHHTVCKEQAVLYPHDERPRFGGPAQEAINDSITQVWNIEDRITKIQRRRTQLFHDWADATWSEQGVR